MKRVSIAGIGAAICLLIAGCQTSPQKTEATSAATNASPASQLSPKVERFIAFVGLPEVARKSLTMVALQTQKVIDTDINDDEALKDAYVKMHQGLNCFTLVPKINPEYAVAILQKMSELVRDTDEKMQKSQAAGKKMREQIHGFETLPVDKACLPFQ